MSRSDAALTQKFAAFYAARGWPVLVVAARTKDRPLTRHAVDDATVDLERVAHWLRRWPDANLAVACGAPGPQVLDVDDVSKVPVEPVAVIRRAPQVRTVRGGHAYFAGTDQGTLALGYGELRGRGSYALAPPSTHPSGLPYRWLAVPRGALLSVPAALSRARNGRNGVGEHAAPARPIRAGEGRHLYLKDRASGLVYGGLLDVGDVAAVLELLFARHCEPLPPPRPNEFTSLARWAVEQSGVAERARARDEFARWVARLEINEEERRRNGGENAAEAV